MKKLIMMALCMGQIAIVDAMHPKEVYQEPTTVEKPFSQKVNEVLRRTRIIINHVGAKIAKVFTRAQKKPAEKTSPARTDDPNQVKDSDRPSLLHRALVKIGLRKEPKLEDFRTFNELETAIKETDKEISKLQNTNLTHDYKENDRIVEEVAKLQNKIKNLKKAPAYIENETKEFLAAREKIDTRNKKPSTDAINTSQDEYFINQLKQPSYIDGAEEAAAEAAKEKAAKAEAAKEKAKINKTAEEIREEITEEIKKLEIGVLDAQKNVAAILKLKLVSQHNPHGYPTDDDVKWSEDLSDAKEAVLKADHDLDKAKRDLAEANGGPSRAEIAKKRKEDYLKNIQEYKKRIEEAKEEARNKKLKMQEIAEAITAEINSIKEQNPNSLTSPAYKAVEENQKAYTVANTDAQNAYDSVIDNGFVHGSGEVAIKEAAEMQKLEREAHTMLTESLVKFKLEPAKK